MAQQKTCYIIGPIGDADTPEREWANFVRKRIIQPAVTACGYENPARADDPAKELIMVDIIKQMFEADLVLADLTNFNPNVYYELGIRHSAQQPAIHLIRDDQRPPFDLGGNKAILISRDHERVITAISEIKERIGAIEKDPQQFYSQIHVYMQMRKLNLAKEVTEVSDKVSATVLNLLLQASKYQSNILVQLYEELVAKPKQLKARYPIPTLAALERMAAEQYPNLYKAAVKEQLGAGNKVIPPSEDKK